LDKRKHFNTKLGSSFSDREYQAVGAEIVASAQEAWAVQLAVKVKSR